MKNRFFYVVWMTLIVSSVNAQDLSLYVGFSQTFMKDMKSMQDYVDLEIPVELKNTQRFPPYWQYGISMRWAISGKYKLGVYAFTTSTGGRATYEDYSGEFTFDQTLKCFGMSVHNEYTVYQVKNSEILVYLQTGYLANWLDLDYYLHLGDESDSQHESFRGSNYIFEGGAQYVIFFLNLGYSLMDDLAYKEIFLAT
ncbi:MAG: hypothetical protein U5K79_02315 [Cyclobacteriaceae bacterium]|nr:hypothetical protein [Cyclobacteriaceae bacterium]